MGRFGRHLQQANGPWAVTPESDHHEVAPQSAFNDHFTLIPEFRLGLYGNGRDYRIGWRLTRLDDVGTEFSFDATWRESANNDGATLEHGVQLKLDTWF